MVVQFCEDCGHLLAVSSSDDIQCEVCGKLAMNTMLTYERVSESSNFPSRLRGKLRSQTQIVTREDIGDGPITEMECPKCSNKQANWSEAQLRSADEGSTIFYCCTKCRYRWKQDN